MRDNFCSIISITVAIIVIVIIPAALIAYTELAPRYRIVTDGKKFMVQERIGFRWVKGRSMFTLEAAKERQAEYERFDKERQIERQSKWTVIKD